MKTVLAALVLLSGAFPAPAAPSTAGCAMKLLEKRNWCPKCDKLFGKDDQKLRKCPDDKTDLTQVEICIQQVYIARCHPDKKGSKPVSCCGNLYDKPTNDEKSVYTSCEGCRVKHRQPTKLVHAPDCPNRKTVKACEHPA
jgi:hypothetical protein